MDPHLSHFRDFWIALRSDLHVLSTKNIMEKEVKHMHLCYKCQFVCIKDMVLSFLESRKRKAGVQRSSSQFGPSCTSDYTLPTLSSRLVFFWFSATIRCGQGAYLS